MQGWGCGRGGADLHPCSGPAHRTVGTACQGRDRVRPREGLPAPPGRVGWHSRAAAGAQGQQAGGGEASPCAWGQGPRPREHCEVKLGAPTAPVLEELPALGDQGKRRRASVPEQDEGWGSSGRAGRGARWAASLMGGREEGLAETRGALSFSQLVSQPLPSPDAPGRAPGPGLTSAGTSSTLRPSPAAYPAPGRPLPLLAPEILTSRHDALLPRVLSPRAPWVDLVIPSPERRKAGPAPGAQPWAATGHLRRLVTLLTSSEGGGHKGGSGSSETKRSRDRQRGRKTRPGAAEPAGASVPSLEVWGGSPCPGGQAAGAEVPPGGRGRPSLGGWVWASQGGAGGRHSLAACPSRSLPLAPAPAIRPLERRGPHCSQRHPEMKRVLLLLVTLAVAAGPGG